MSQQNPPYTLRSPHPRIVEEHGDFLSLANHIIETWVLPGPDQTNDRKLRVAGIWGDRGSGKTSMLLTLLHQLQSASSRLELPAPGGDEPPIGTQLLFEPSRLVTVNSVLLSLIEFLREDRYPGLDGNKFNDVFKLEAHVAFSAEFLRFRTETACTTEDLVSTTVEFFKERALRGLHIAKVIGDAFRPLAKRVLLLIDDLDLQPHLAHELLQTLHTFFANVDMTVILVADRSQLSSAIQYSLRKDHSDSASLAAKIIAKYVHAEWHLPIPTPAERGKAVWAPGDGPSLESWWAPLQNLKTAHASGGAPILRRDAPENDDEQQIFVTGVREFFHTSLPSTWRGVNRFYNRLVSWANAHTQPDGTVSPPMSIGPRVVRSDYALAFMCQLHSLDESFPELEILAAFEQDPHRLRDGLLTIGGSDEPDETFPVLDRLYDGRSLTGRRLGHAINLLSEFGRLWASYWLASARDQGGSDHDDNKPDDANPSEAQPRCFVAISVQRDALAESEDYRQSELPGIETVHLDFQSPVTGRRSGWQVRDLCEQAGRELDDRLTNKVSLYVFGFAPLSLFAYIGWRTHYWYVVAIAQSSDRSSMFELESTKMSSQRELMLLKLAEHEDPSLAGATTIVLDVRPDAGAGQPPPFVQRDGTPLQVKSSLKLYTEGRFELQASADVDSVIHDLSLVLHELRNRKKDPVHDFHVALSCPGALALLVGRALHPFAPVSLYEYDPSTPCYEYVTTIG